MIDLFKSILYNDFKFYFGGNVMRLFKTSNLRNYISLDGLWDFCIDPCNKGESEEWFKNFPQDAEQMYVPL